MKDEIKQNKNYGQDLRVRTRQYAVRIIRLCESLPKGMSALVIGKQVLRSGTSVGAHYREAKRAKSDADFIHKIEGALQELEETGYWLELLGESEVIAIQRLEPLLTETNELLAILTTIAKKAKGR